MYDTSVPSPNFVVFDLKLYLENYCACHDFSNACSKMAYYIVHVHVHVVRYSGFSDLCNTHS